MTLREYIQNNAEDIVAELCQYQSCDNCSISALYGFDCPLLSNSIDEVIDEEIEPDKSIRWVVFLEEVAVHDISKEKVELLKADEFQLDKLFKSEAKKVPYDSCVPGSRSIYNNKLEAMERYNELKSSTKDYCSTYYWGNNTLSIQRVCIGKIEVDDDGDELIPCCDYDYKYLEII